MTSQSPNGNHRNLHNCCGNHIAFKYFTGLKKKPSLIILKSYSVTEQIVEELNLGISYFKKGFIISNELFKNSPFTVTIDSTKLQVTGVKYEIDFINKKSFKLRLKADDKYAYNVIKEKFDKSKSVNINFKEEYNFGDTITSPLFTFSINKTSFFDIDKIKKENKKFSFKLHPKRQYAQKLIKDININPINKETSILKLSIKGSNPKKNIEILDKLTEIYIRSGLNEKNYSVTLTRGIIDTLDDEELEGVIAHELMHIRNNDVRLLVISIIFVGIFSLIINVAFRSILFGGMTNSRRRDGKGNGGFGIGGDGRGTKPPCCISTGSSSMSRSSMLNGTPSGIVASSALPI